MIAHPPFPWAKYDDRLTWCRVCGLSVLRSDGDPSGDATRCERHPNRNPCAIDGCKRSTGAMPTWSGNNLWMCGEHWRALVPPGSPTRRVYLRFFRRAKKFGWTVESTAAFWRIWHRIVATARARAAGDVDMDEVNRLFGWERAA